MGLALVVYLVALYLVIAFVHEAHSGARGSANEEFVQPPLWWVVIHSTGRWLTLQLELLPERWCGFVCRFKVLRRSLRRRMTEVVRRGWRLIGASVE